VKNFSPSKPLLTGSMRRSSLSEGEFPIFVERRHEDRSLISPAPAAIANLHNLPDYNRASTR